MTETERAFCEVAVPLPVAGTFHYRIPKHLRSQAEPGKRVWVPFRTGKRVGYLVGFIDHPEVRGVKPIEAVIDPEPLFRPEMLALTRWISRNTLAGWGACLEAAIPGVLRRAGKPPSPRKAKPIRRVVPSSPWTPTAPQAKALQAILQSVRDRRHETFLLHGVTGSGKTEVYLQGIAEVLARGLGAIVLVPEISLTPQTVEHFQARFGQERVAVLHSRMTESRRYEAWQRIRSGASPVVVGTRSAIFAPLAEIGLIVVDEEHEPSYKQEETPRYHAREVAIERGRLHQAAVVLGSATPSLETFSRAVEGATGEGPPIRLLPLPARIEEVPLPEVEIVDMRQELAHGRRDRVLSRALEEALARTLKERQQAMLFLNRRGFSTFLHCRSCGAVLRCKACRIPLTYHMATRTLQCHTCSASQKAPETCPKCRSEYVRFSGTGTERVESELARAFPQATAARMDTDATQAAGSHEKILDAFREHRVDVLVGTQMIAKGLDFPRVTLVGVISADTALNLPDFRSAERTFALLTQVAGRAGRGRMPGKVIIQTYAPHHYAIQAAKTHDYATFFKKEMEIRRELDLPPFSRLTLLLTRAGRETQAAQFAQALAAACRKCSPQIQVQGPAPAPVRRVRRQYRWQVLLKTAGLEPIREKLPEVLRSVRPPKGGHLTVDVDPL